MAPPLEARLTTKTTSIDGDASGYLHVCEGRKKFLARSVVALLEYVKYY